MLTPVLTGIFMDYSLQIILPWPVWKVRTIKKNNNNKKKKHKAGKSSLPLAQPRNLLTVLATRWTARSWIYLIDWDQKIGGNTVNCIFPRTHFAFKTWADSCRNWKAQEKEKENRKDKKNFKNMCKGDFRKASLILLLTSSAFLRAICKFLPCPHTPGTQQLISSKQKTIRNNKTLQGRHQCLLTLWMKCKC